jgi:transcriptional regulator with GAF, ATPase, and Fis domain
VSHVYSTLPWSLDARDLLSNKTIPYSLHLRNALTKIERNLIERALEQAKGVQAEAARMLGLSRSDMGYRLSKYAIEK